MSEHTCIQTRDGQLLDLANPKPENIDPFTLAVILSRRFRFGGHTTFEYSVASHSIMTAMLVARELCTLPVVTDEHDKELILAALLHDAHEAYWGFGDIQTPAKSVLGTPFRIALREHARRFDVVIAQRFGLDVDLFHHEFVKRADLVARAIERRDCMSALRPGISCSTSFVEVSEVLPDETVRIKRRSEQDDVTWFLGSLASLRPAERASIVSSYQEEYRCDPSSVILHQWV